MALYNVADYSKRFILGIDMGYGIFYDLKTDNRGSGNIYLYKRYKTKVEDGLTDDVLSELYAERRDIERNDNIDSTYSTARFGQLDFYKIFFYSELIYLESKRYELYLITR